MPPWQGGDMHAHMLLSALAARRMWGCFTTTCGNASVIPFCRAGRLSGAWKRALRVAVGQHSERAHRLCSPRVTAGPDGDGAGSHIAQAPCATAVCVPW